MNTSRKNNRLLLGIALGMSAGYLLKTKKGQNMIKQSKDYVVNQLEETRKNGRQAMNTASDYISTLADKGREYLNNTSETIDRKTPDPKDLESMIYRELNDLTEKIEMKKAELANLMADYTDKQ